MSPRATLTTTRGPAEEKHVLLLEILRKDGEGEVYMEGLLRRGEKGLLEKED